eukprot:1144874-Lingulodinium_polyedra.AAC.1
MLRFQSVSTFACATPTDHGLPGRALLGASPATLATLVATLGLMGADVLVIGVAGVADIVAGV